MQAGEIDTFEKARGEDVTTLIEKKDKVGFEVYNSGPESSTNFLAINEKSVTYHRFSILPYLSFWPFISVFMCLFLYSTF